MKLYVVIVAVVAIAIAGPVAVATSFTWVGSASGAVNDWGTPANWSPSGVPNGSGDNVTIGNVMDDPLLDTNRTIGNATIQAGGDLHANGHTLTVAGTLTINAAGGGNPAGQLDIDQANGSVAVTNGFSNSGLINVASSTASLAFSSTVTAGGTIDGQSNSAVVSVSSGITVTLTGNITGHLEINGAGTFQNNGLVRADDPSGTLKIAVTGTVDDSTLNADRWEVNAAGAILEFASTIGTLNTLDGNLRMTTGDGDSKIAVFKTLTTNGRLNMTVGTLAVNENVTMGTDGTPGHFMSARGLIAVAAGKTFTHK
jgi:hypothetical protein